MGHCHNRTKPSHEPEAATSPRNTDATDEIHGSFCPSLWNTFAFVLKVELKGAVDEGEEDEEEEDEEEEDDDEDDEDDDEELTKENGFE